MCYKAIALKRVWWEQKDRYINQWNRIDSVEVDPHISVQLIFNKDNSMEKGKSFNIWCYSKRIPVQEKIMNINPYLIPYTNIKSKWITYLKLKYRIIIKSCRKTEVNIYSLRMSKFFLTRNLKKYPTWKKKSA